MTLERTKTNWDDVSHIDPFYAMTGVSESEWNIEAFLATGDAQIDNVIRTASNHGLPKGREAALDFGCGIGRNARGMRKHFQHYTGVDISAGLIAKAREIHANLSNCEFVLNTEGHLRRFGDDAFDFVFTYGVLQHVPEKAIIQSYVAEFIRVIKPGGIAVFHLHTNIPLRGRIQPRRRVYNVLRSLGVTADTLMHTLKLHPYDRYYVPVPEVNQFVSQARGDVVHTQDEKENTMHESTIFYVAKGASRA